jgi:ABC-2 type transport system ATP-binding protein
MIEAKVLNKTYENRHAVKAVSFAIGEGEICGLVGLNGAGKSTILKMLSTWLLPTSGDATIGGFSIVNEAAKVREIIGYLPDRPPLYSDMEARAYLRYVAQLKGVKDLEQATQDALAKTNLLDHQNVRVKELSHGYQQRLGIAAAIVNRPKVLILDEPINGLDPVQIVEMRDLIVSFREQMSVLLSSHILSEITRTCDRILMIHHGEIVAEGSERDLASKQFRIRVKVAKEAKNLEADILKAQFAVSVEASKDGSLLVTCLADARQDLAHLAVKYGLLEIGLDKSDLEELFMKLVQGGSSHS